jgi:hypothetical protein
LKPHPRATAVLVDELNAGGFKGAPNTSNVARPRLTYSSFKLVYGHDAGRSMALGWTSRQTTYSLFSVFAHPPPGAAAVFVDELDAACFESAP